jgi:hypothetical protein
MDDTTTNNELTSFLREASKKSYANTDSLRAESTRLNSVDYHFKKEDLIYHDTYFGERDFIGEEIVYKNNEPIWGANYYGYILSAEIDEKILYGFLRQVLLQDFSDIIPVRGPKDYSLGEWKYVNMVDGYLSRFIGREEIYRDNQLIYRGYYHGGSIS